VLPLLQNLQKFTIEQLAVAANEEDLAALEAQCQSELERQVLHAIYKAEIPLPDSAQKTIYDGDAPLVSADFFYKPNHVVFVDGPAHTKDYVSAADKAKRKQLKGKGYRIVAIEPDTIAESLETLRKRLGS
jgi:hypothetical protein